MQRRAFRLPSFPLDICAFREQPTHLLLGREPPPTTRDRAGSVLNPAKARLGGGFPLAAVREIGYQKAPQTHPILHGDLVVVALYSPFSPQRTSCTTSGRPPSPSLLRSLVEKMAHVPFSLRTRCFCLRRRK